ncbi:MAG: hypothetical protein ACE5I7_17650, partial [Candidatus Binatia bacterium]
MRRVKRPTKRVPNTGQWGFGFCQGAVPPAAERQPIADDRFLEDDPSHIVIGDRRLDHSTIGKFVRLHEAVLGQEFVTALAAWVVQRLRLRPGLASIDGTLVTAA